MTAPAPGKPTDAPGLVVVEDIQNATAKHIRIANRVAAYVASHGLDWHESAAIIRIAGNLLDITASSNRQPVRTNSKAGN